ncbi:MAG: ATP-binding protein [Bacteroidales bacterium]|nr:ATP-binding protein [Bacteroidales bacterium]
MDKSFIFGKATYGDNFTDREFETVRLSGNFRSGVNTIIVSPRRWGKTSLVRKVSKIINDEAGEVKVVSIDAFLCRTEIEFYRVFANEVIRQTSTKLEEWLDYAKRFLARLSPKFKMGTDSPVDFSISFDVDTDWQSEYEILNLPQKIAEEKNITIVVCIDEFQQVAEFSDSKNFQKKMRSVWQLQDKVSYCLYGSKMHVLSGMFSKQSMPFYKFGDLMFLQKISTQDWITYICSRFEKTGKHITDQLAEKICDSVDNHSSYVQQFAWLVWTKTIEIAGNEEFDEAYDDLLNQNGILFYQYIDGLSSYQLNFLKALADGNESGFTNSDLMKKYNLSSSANVARIKKALEKKEIVDISGQKVSLIDPVFKIWLQREL